MPVKKWFRRLQPMQLYVVLTLSVTFLLSELAISYLTHSLTLLMDSYKMLCNIMAIVGCMVTLKHCRHINAPEDTKQTEVEECAFDEENMPKRSETKVSPIAVHQENKLKNTFGWARIDVIVMLFCSVFLISLQFSLFVEALQTLVHIDHQDAMHRPILVFSMGLTGLVVNVVCYFLIGGYTFHQGSFLHVNESGEVILDSVVTNQSVQKGERRLSRTRAVRPSQYRQRQGFLEMFRDVVATIFVMICSVLIYFADKDLAKFIDPILSLVSASILLLLSYPYIKESCLILLQTIPGSIDIDVLKKQLMDHFPDVANVHDFHIWQLTPSKVISTVHIIFKNSKDYVAIMNEIKSFFLDNGITQVTIQPEFSKQANTKQNSIKYSCLMKCDSKECMMNHCCPNTETENVIDNALVTKSEVPMKFEIPDTLNSIKIDNNEFPKRLIDKVETISEKIDAIIDGAPASTTKVGANSTKL